MIYAIPLFPIAYIIINIVELAVLSAWDKAILKVPTFLVQYMGLFNILLFLLFHPSLLIAGAVFVLMFGCLLYLKTQPADWSVATLAFISPLPALCGLLVSALVMVKKKSQTKLPFYYYFFWGFLVSGIFYIFFLVFF